jgi:rod shape-determining protein MreC
MRNLFLFIIRYNAFILFILLEIFSIYLIVQNNKYHQAGFFNSSNYLSGIVFTRYSSALEYFSLKEENQKLAEENAMLRAQLPSSQYVNTFQKISIKDSINQQVYSYIPAKAINITTNSFNNYITLDKGSNQGITKNMAVISPDGIVGIVKNVSSHFAVVIPLLHKDLKISGRVGNDKFIGSVSWDGKDPRYAQFDEIPKQITVKKGDKVVTGGGSKFFPENIMIGTVEEVDKNTSDNFYDIRIKLSTRFTNLSNVYIVNYLLHEEQEKLEQATQ